MIQAITAAAWPWAALNLHCGSASCQMEWLMASPKLLNANTEGP